MTIDPTSRRNRRELVTCGPIYARTTTSTASPLLARARSVRVVFAADGFDRRLAIDPSTRDDTV